MRRRGAPEWPGRKARQTRSALLVFSAVVIVVLLLGLIGYTGGIDVTIPQTYDSGPSAEEIEEREDAYIAARGFIVENFS